MLEERIRLIRSVCEFCPHNNGFAGPQGRQQPISICGAQKVVMPSGVCPHGKWDASNLAIPPIVSDSPVSGQIISWSDAKNSELGKVLVIVANGPSHKEIPLTELTGVDFMCINTPDDRIWQPKYWVVSDQEQVDHNRAKFQEYDGIFLSAGSVKSLPRNGLRVQTDGGRAFGLTPSKFTIGNTTTYLAMQIAIWLGYAHIYVVGLDMGTGKEGTVYPWGSHFRIKDETRIKRFPNEAKSFDVMVKSKPELLSRFTLCSTYNKWPFTQHFENIPQDQVVRTINERHNSSHITLITPTGARQEAFGLCERWMERQTLKPDRWIVVDDGPEPVKLNLGQELIRPDTWKGENTQMRNLALGLARAGTSLGNIFIIEDDDWYAPQYLSALTGLLQSHDIAGLSRSTYYNVKYRLWRAMGNTTWASACHTGFRSTMASQMLKALGPAFDIRFWSGPGTKALIHDKLSVGIKGMPGRNGAASGHGLDINFLPDPFLTKMNSLLGEDAKTYEPFYHTLRQSQS